MVSQAGISRYFDLVICADEVRRPKPALDMLKKAMRALGVRPHEVILIGRHQTDLAAGRRASMFTLGYRISCRRQIKRLAELIPACRAAT